MAAYRQHLAFEEKKSLAGTSREVRRLEAWIGSEMPVAELASYQRLEQLAADLRHGSYVRGGQRRAYSRGTVRSRMALLHAAFRYGEKVALLPATPRFPTIKATEPRQESISLSEYQRIRAKLSEPDADVIDFMWSTGWRVSEALSLTWEMVLHEPLRIWLPTSKTGRGRLFPVVEPLFVALMRRRTAARRLDSRWVFHVEGRPEKYSGLNRRWEAATRASGVPGKWLHDFRRAAYQRFLANGMDPQTARLLIGHASSQTMDRYNVVTLPRLVDGLERVVAVENLRRTGAGVGREGGGSPS